jgi:hypothetical protein
MPLLDVALSSELEGYLRRILSRIAGGAASLIACALLGWSALPISFKTKLSPIAYRAYLHR